MAACTKRHDMVLAIVAEGAGQTALLHLSAFESFYIRGTRTHCLRPACIADCILEIGLRDVWIDETKIALTVSYVKLIWDDRVGVDKRT